MSENESNYHGRGPSCQKIGGKGAFRKVLGRMADYLRHGSCQFTIHGITVTCPPHMEKNICQATITQGVTRDNISYSVKFTEKEMLFHNVYSCISQFQNGVKLGVINRNAGG